MKEILLFDKMPPLCDKQQRKSGEQHRYPTDKFNLKEA
jgi:hypothetical protein